MKRFFGFLGLMVMASAQVAAGPDLDLSTLDVRFDRIVKAAKAEIGVSLVHLESGAKVSINGNKTFPMASVYKLPIAIELLTQVALGKKALTEAVTIEARDVRPCCDVSKHHPRGGVTFTVAQLLDMMIVESDNTASDAVLKFAGGPAVVNRRLRALGFTAMNVSRYEGDINLEMAGVQNPPAHDEWTLDVQRRLIADVPRDELYAARIRYMRDPRDQSTPDEMARFLARLYKGELLPPRQTDLLLNLMAHADTGPRRLRGRLPPGTIVAHKTGTTAEVINDVGIITLPGDAGHVVLAVFGMNGRTSVMQNTIAQLAAAAYEGFTGRPLPAPEKIDAVHKTGTGKARARRPARTVPHRGKRAGKA